MHKLFRTFIVIVAFIILGSAIWQSVRSKYTTVPALDLWVLSVGQGESVFLHEAGGNTILFDGGPDEGIILSELHSVMPFWDHHISTIILSHNHRDHLQGLLAVLHNYSIGEVWISGAKESAANFTEWQQLLKTDHIPTHIVQAGYSENIGTLHVVVLHPTRSYVGVIPPNQHDADIVTKITYQQNSVLLTGDLDEQHETDILHYCESPTCSLVSDVLQIPHHGSKTGLLPAFLLAVQPQVAFISVGQHNRYHHPTKETLAKLANAHIPFFRTDQDGQIHFILYGNRLHYERVSGSTAR